MEIKRGMSDILKISPMPFSIEKTDAMANKLTNAYMQKHKVLYDNERKRELVKEYNRLLIDIGYGLSRSALKKENIVDMRAAFVETTEPTDMLTIMKPELENDFGMWCKNTDLFYATIPCFTSGVLHINKNRYIYWELKNVDITDKSMSVYLMDYMARDGYWQPGVSGTINISGVTTNDDDVRMDIKTGHDEMLFSKIYKSIPYSELHWSKSDINIWEEVVIPFAILTEGELESRGTNNLCELCRHFIYDIVILNYFLNKEKPKAKRKYKKAKSDVGMLAESNIVADNRVTRTIGVISVKSEKVPKESTEKTVSKYKVASWRTRGHMRQLKSGKQIYIKESIHKRKCLNIESEVDPKTTIKLRG